jgi:hypothetical protein
MMKSPIQKLCRAVELGFQRMGPQRDARYKFLAQYVGPFYAKNKGTADSEERKASPINLMYNAVTTLVPNLVWNDPRVKIRTQVLAFKPYADTLELATNQLIAEIKLRATLRKAITDAMFGAGFIKTGIATSGQTLDLDGKWMDIGQPYADVVDFDDMVLDPLARHWDEMKFVGNRVRVAKFELLESGLYDNKLVEKLCARRDRLGKDAASLSGDYNAVQAFTGDVAEYVDLVEVYLPHEQTIVTIPHGNAGGGADYEKVLRTVEYEGPERGPYHMLGFAHVPDNVLPIPPASIWYYLHTMGNRIARKVTRQAERMKQVLAYEGSAVEDAQEISDADDGEAVRVDNIAGIKEVGFGGTSDDAYAYLQWVKGEFNQQAGNIDLLGGTSADQGTLGQSEILQSNGQIRLADMQNQVQAFTGEVADDLVFFLHTDPLIDLMLTKRVGGTDTQVRYTPEMREGSFKDYVLKVEPYSMAKPDPAKKARSVSEFITAGLPAIAQNMQAFGPAFRPDAAIKIWARENGVEEAEEMFDSAMLAQQQQMLMAQLSASGIVPDGKAASFAQNGGIVPPPAPPAGPTGYRPQQPNPMQMGPTGGTSPQQQSNAAVQERGAAYQAARFA